VPAQEQDDKDDDHDDNNDSEADKHGVLLSRGGPRNPVTIGIAVRRSTL
jgi:hypothetical protein